MSLEQLALKAGFHVNGDIYSPVRKERVTEPLVELLKLVEQELLNELSQEREPHNVNYSTNDKYAETISRTMRRIRS